MTTAAAQTMRPPRAARVDPFEVQAGEDRCIHDQLIFAGRSTCSICLRLPDVPMTFFADFDPEPEPVRDMWLITDRYVDCLDCNRELPPDRRVKWDAQRAGVVCMDCLARAPQE